MILLTGATGTFGQAWLEGCDGDIRAYSRDEYKQSQLSERFPGVRWLLGDVRDLERLRRACDGVTTVIHAAALKQVPACEYNPGECVKTNVLGSMNVVEACLDRGVEKAILVSSDKAVHPVNVYGASKLCAEKLWLAANAYGGARCKFSVVRYGNVKGSRGSVLTRRDHVWENYPSGHDARRCTRCGYQTTNGHFAMLDWPGAVQDAEMIAKYGEWQDCKVPLTDSRATRFWMEPEQAVQLVLLALETMQGGEVYVPKLSSSRVADVIDHDGTETGLRPGEKLHEQLISDEEVTRTFEYEDHYVVHPSGTQFWKNSQPTDVPWPQMLAPDFRYTSNA